jgi:hypothetical protein
LLGTDLVDFFENPAAEMKNLNNVKKKLKFLLIAIFIFGGMPL